MRWALVFSVLFGIGIPTFAGDAKTRGLAVWDTRTPAPALLRLNGKNNWQQLDKANDVFKGDAIVSNGRIAVVLRRGDAIMEIHAIRTDGAVARSRARLLSAAGEPAVSVDRLMLVENGKTAITLDATFRTAKGGAISAKFRIKRGDVALQVEPGAGASKLRVDCPGRFVILPDFFADDITIDATRLPLDSVDLPSENFVLHPTANGDAITLCVFENRGQDIKVTMTGKGAERQVTGSEITFDKRKVWVAVLDAPQVWHATPDLTPADGGKIIKLDWRMPYVAQWRIDFHRDNDLTDSWEMLLQERGFRTYTRHTWLGAADPETVAADREHWNTVLGSFPYPVWSDSDGVGYIQPIKNRFLVFTGPALIYPIHRIKETPLDAYTVVDVMRNTLGVGPCEHILDVPSHKENYIGQATCGVRDILNPIYESKQQKARRSEINKTLDDGLIFVKHIRTRINDYIAFGKKMRVYLAEQRKKHPDLTEFIDEMDKLTAEIDAKHAFRVDRIKTPEHVAKMMAEFRKNVLDYTGADAVDCCKDFTKALVVIGDNQDELSGECRWVVKTLRQRAGIRMALDPRVTPIATEIRLRTQEVMRNPAWHEMPRH
ncbi:MAG: hypothetical protein FJ303_19695 [Planctomycetes bacterium]|nr:hypothetical protein [Planctomycetota bacterium]